jgi:TRAP-type C4-dicarboxylate transport system permease small subunit
MRPAIDRSVRLLEETGGVIALAVMFLAIVVQVIWRYLFLPLIWPFELSIFMYICLIYLGAALAARRKTHVAFDILFNALPPKVQRVISTAVQLFGALVLLILVPSGIQLMIQSHVLKSASLRIPWSFLILVYLIGVVLMAAHLIVDAVGQWKRPAGGKA